MHCVVQALGFGVGVWNKQVAVVNDDFFSNSLILIYFTI